MRSYKFRLYPSKAQESQMKHHLWIEKNLWNSLLEKTKERYEKEKKFLTIKEMAELVKGTELYSQSAQSVFRNLDKSLKAKIRAKKKGMKWGFPRFKSFERMKSLTYPQHGFWLNKKLKVSPFGEIPIKKHREIKGVIKTLTLKREPTGKWFASFSVEQEPETPKINTGKRVGMDLGLMKFATLSDGNIIKNPRHLKAYEEKLAIAQRLLSRKIKGSHNRKKAKKRVALLHENVANTRMDFLHKLSHQFVNNYSLIALEKLASQEMSEENYGKQINDAGWNMFASMLSYKAGSAGCQVVFVNPKDTTKECSQCGELVKKDLWERWHDCPTCALSIDRDINASINILNRATAGIAESNASGEVPQGTSSKEEAHAFKRG